MLGGRFYESMRNCTCPFGATATRGSRRPAARIISADLPQMPAKSGQGFLADFWKQWRAYVGPALLVSIGYMDPGNWGTDLQSGAQFKYGLLWVVGVASLMAIFLQVISARLGRGDRARTWPSAAAIGIPSGRAGPTGCCANWPSAPAIWPKCSAAPSPSTC
jgi:hypothetical protein